MTVETNFIQPAKGSIEIKLGTLKIILTQSTAWTRTRISGNIFLGSKLIDRITDWQVLNKSIAGISTPHSRETPDDLWSETGTFTLIGAKALADLIEEWLIEYSGLTNVGVDFRKIQFIKSARIFFSYKKESE